MTLMRGIYSPALPGSKLAKEHSGHNQLHKIITKAQQPIDNLRSFLHNQDGTVKADKKEP